MTATTRSASSTPSSMSVASSDASLTLCRGTLRTSIGAGTGPPFLCGENGAGAVPGKGVGDVFQGRDDGAGATGGDEPQAGVHFRAHAAAGELTGRRVLPELGGRHLAQWPGGRRAEADHHVRDV